jgi:hypothetical protein
MTLLLRKSSAQARIEALCGQAVSMPGIVRLIAQVKLL